jgi:hypothetical protein
MSYFLQPDFASGVSFSSGATFVQVRRDSGPTCSWHAEVQELRQAVDKFMVITGGRERDIVAEIRADPIRTLEEVDRLLQQKAAEVVEAWKNQPAFSLSSALEQIRRNLKR